MNRPEYIAPVLPSKMLERYGGDAPRLGHNTVRPSPPRGRGHSRYFNAYGGRGEPATGVFISRGRSDFGTPMESIGLQPSETGEGGKNSGALSGLFMKTKSGGAALRMFHTESTECFIDRITEAFDHRVHREHLGTSLRSLCFNSLTSVRNSLPPSIAATNHE